MHLSSGWQGAILMPQKMYGLLSIVFNSVPRKVMPSRDGGGACGNFASIAAIFGVGHGLA
jgi:hypothetical protein